MFSTTNLQISFDLLFFSIVAGGNKELVCTGGNPGELVDMDNAGDYDGWGAPCIFQGYHKQDLLHMCS